MEPTQSVLYYLEHRNRLRALDGSLPSNLAADTPVDEERESHQSSYAPFGIDEATIVPVTKGKFDRPDSLPAERIKAGLVEILLGCLLFAGLVAFCVERFS
jgi:hypothetical protein